MGQTFGRKPDDWKASNIDQQTEKLKKTLELIGFEEDGTMIICQDAMDNISREFQNLVSCFQAKPGSIDAIVLISLEKVFNQASALKQTAMNKGSKRNGNSIESKYSTRLSEELNTTKEAKPKETAQSGTRTVPFESHQLATALEVVRQLPKTLRVLQKWITSVEVKNGSRMFIGQTLDYINEEIKLDTVQVSSDNSILLSKRTVDKILQHSTEYLRFHEETESYNRETTGETLLQQHAVSNLKPNESNINQNVEQASLPPKITYHERPLKYVQVLDPLPSGATNSFMTTLQAELEQRRIKLSLTDVKSFNADETGSNLVMVICNNHSRLQANVANTFREIAGNRFHRILLSVLHCKKERLLPSAPSKAELKDDTVFGDIPEVLDFAFDKDEPNGGIYECEFNKRAFELIEHLVESERLVSMQADAIKGSSNKKKRTAE